MTAPTFFIAGAQKAGTTSLYAMLAQHPDVFMSDPKEPGYFIRGFDDPERWQTLKRPDRKGAPISLAGIPLGVFTAQDYAGLFAGDAARKAKHRGEVSTPYLPSPHAARRIAEVYPQARIILSLRDPVARAYSAWGHNSARGKESAATFEAAIEHELAGGRDDWIWGWRYLHTGLYSQHVARYLSHFPRERVLILKFETFRDDVQGTFDRICEFLEIPAASVSIGQRENATVSHTKPLLAGARTAFTNPGALKSLVQPLLPKEVRQAIRRSTMSLLDRFADRPPPLTPETARRLAAYFADDCTALSRMVDLDISDWAPLRLGAEPPCRSAETTEKPNA